MLAAHGKTEEAIAHFEHALEIAPRVPELHYVLGNALATQGKVVEAVAEYREALRLRPDWREPAEQISTLLGSMAH